MKSVAVIFSILVFTHYATAQYRIAGNVRSIENKPLQDVSITLQGTHHGTTSDRNGDFELEGVPPGNYLLIASFVGFHQQTISIAVPHESPEKMIVTLVESSSQLDEVVVVARSESELLRTSAASIGVIDAKPDYSRSISATELLGRVPGVQVRHNGGVGNSAEISIHGLSGRQVRMFVDGIPMDFLLPVEELGVGSSLAVIPLNLIDRIEAYKGVVPVSLGADALGGAINMVTKREVKNALEASVQASSFNTWQGVLNIKNTNPFGFTYGISGSYTYSDNNYRIDDVKFVNAFGNPETISARKFHDAFCSQMVKVHAGILNKFWVDKAILSFSYTDLYDEIQHNFEMRQPYGEALNKGQTYNSSLQFEKYAIKNKFDVSFYLSYNRINTEFIDTARSIYSWRGEVVGYKTYGGEITTSQSFLRLNGNNISTRINVVYHIKPSLKILFNGVASHFMRKGKDPVAARYYGSDFFRSPVSIQKNIAGIAIEKEWLDQRVTSSTALKAYHYESRGFKIENNEAIVIYQNRFQSGFSQSFKWMFPNELIGKLSYEYATRMPDRVEALGDFSAAITANPDLLPEVSQNINIGASMQKENCHVEVSAFLRSVENIIMLQAAPPPVLSKYENLLKARIMGIETEVQVKPFSWLSVRTSATYQDLRNRSVKEKAGVSNDRYFNVRLPNKPYLFGNSEIQIEKKKIFYPEDKIQLWYSTGYVHEFFRYWEIDGRSDEKLTIPGQLVSNLGVAYELKNTTLSLESQNIFNAKAYDNFRVQKPGRSWHIKLRLSLTKTKQV